MIGEDLETSGWRQGSIVRQEDLAQILGSSVEDEADLVAIVASQSCDIANNNYVSDPLIELSIGRIIEKPNGNLTFNKNPRALHVQLQECAESLDVSNDIFLELKAFEKATVDKNALAGLVPDSDRVLVNKQLDGYVSWLAARYSRPALPTEFNNRMADADPKDKRKKKAKAVNEHLSGIYVEIIPDEEISQDENYRVNLLGLVSADFDGDKSKVETSIEAFAEIMRKAGMEVNPVVRKEDQVSVALIKRFKRFYYDDLSYKSDTDLPIETKINL